MQDIQNTQETQETLTTKCSSCSKTQIFDNFGFKKNADPYKTCFRCRGKTKPTITDNRPGSSNDHINILVEEQEPILTLDRPLSDKVEGIFKSYGYQVGPFSSRIATYFDGAMDSNCAAWIFTDVICANKIAAFSTHSPNEVAVLFGPGDKAVYGMNLQTLISLTHTRFH